VNAFLVDALMTSSTLGENSNCLVVSGEYPSPISTSFNFGALDERLVIGFLGGIFPTDRTKLEILLQIGCWYIKITTVELIKINTYLFFVLA
jgi:hypothetical protein